MPENDDRPSTPKPAVPRNVLRTGTYLHTSCPACRGDLVDDGWIRLRASNASGKVGELKLSPRFNVFDKEATIPFDSGAPIPSLQCPRCNTSLIVSDQTCELCGSPAAKVRVSAVRLEVTLYFCTRAGCRWHGVSEEDRRRLILDRTDEKT